MRNRLTALISCAAALLILAGIYVAFRSRGTEQEGFVTAPAIRGNITTLIAASGTIEPIRLVSVGAQVSGRVVGLHVELGQQVTEGQPIAEIDSIPQLNTVQRNQAALNALQAQRERAKVVLRQTESAFRRQGDIVAGKAGTRQEYEAAEAAYGIAQADIAALDAQIEGATVNVRNARTELAYTQITAPIEGTVVAIVTKLGQTVISSQIAPTIIRLADLGTMSVKAKVSEADIGRLRPGMPVLFSTLAQPDRRYETTLKTIDPAPDQIAIEANASTQAGGNASGIENPAVYFNARFEIANGDGALKPLMTALVSFILAEAKDAVLVPTAGLQRTGADQGRVRILGQDGRTEERSVRTGLADGAQIQVLDGVVPGEAVIIADPRDGATFAKSQNRP
jgi:macrolide-specific efflux system membrane fusion protein